MPLFYHIFALLSLFILTLMGYGPKEPETGYTPAIFLCTEWEGEPYPVDGEMGDAMWMSPEMVEQLRPSLFPPFADGVDTLLKCLGLTRMDGGPGSGNFGHEGVPGQVGGSLPNGGDAGLPSMNRVEAASVVSKYGIGTTVKITKKSGKQITFTKIGENKWSREDQPEFEYEDLGVGGNCWKSEVEVKAKAPETETQEKKAEEKKTGESSGKGSTDTLRSSGGNPEGPNGTVAAMSVSELVGEENLAEFDTGNHPNKYPPNDPRWGAEPGEYTVYRSGPLSRGVIFTANEYEGSSIYAKAFPDGENRDIDPINSGVYSYTVQIENPFVAKDMPETYEKLFGIKPKLEPSAAQIRKGVTTGDLWVKADNKITSALKKQGYDAWLMTNPAPPAKKELNLIGASRSTMQVTSRKVPNRVQKRWNEAVEKGSYFSYAYSGGKSQGVTMSDWFKSSAYKEGKESGKWA